MMREVVVSMGPAGSAAAARQKAVVLVRLRLPRYCCLRVARASAGVASSQRSAGVQLEAYKIAGQRYEAVDESTVLPAAARAPLEASRHARSVASCRPDISRYGKFSCSFSSARSVCRTTQR